MADGRRSSRGEVSIALDVRNPDAETARFVDVDELLALLTALRAITGPSSAFFDFGVLTLKGISLEGILERFTPPEEVPADA